MRNILIGIVAIFILIILGRNLNPFSSNTFIFHDQTQAARIQEFTFNLQHLQIPPRIAPHFSYEMSYPVFNFYAPTSYWITSGLMLLGFSVVTSLKLSFLLAILLGLIGMYLLLKKFFSFMPSLLGAMLYVSSPWVATEIFVRGNLGEVWFIALFPLTLFFLCENSTSDSKRTFILSVICTSLLLTVHNVLSIVSLPIIILYLLLLKNKKKNLLVLLSSVLLSMYFLLPAFIESSWIAATSIAQQTHYYDHFLCLSQLWKISFWGFGGSTAGCEYDGFSFMLGKILIVLGGIGVIVFGINQFKKRQKNVWIYALIFAFSGFALFLTLYPSKFIWDTIKPMAIFQFPWRFLVLSIFGLAFFSSYLFSKVKHIPFITAIVVITIYAVFSGGKYFYGSSISVKNFNQQYLSKDYIEQKVVYSIPEYIPKEINYGKWKNYKKDFNAIITSDGYVHVLEDSTYNKTIETNGKHVRINLFNFPYWRIYINNQLIVPAKTDSLVRPLLAFDDTSKKTIRLEYQQTFIERVGYSLSIIILLLIAALCLSKPLWKRFQKIYE